MDSDSTLLHLKPENILTTPTANAVRFSILPADVADLKAQILDMGGVQTPVEVEPLETPKGKLTHRLLAGFRRHEAVTQLNAEGAGLTLPAIEHTVTTAVDRAKHQLSENLHRKSLSPMDMAVSIKHLIDLGVDRTTIRTMFARPGSKKGAASVPASNAWINIVLNMLDLPKAIQGKIHDGSVGVSAAYELSKVAPEKRAAVLERAEAARQKDLEDEAKADEKLAAEQQKMNDEKAKLAEHDTAISNAKLEIEACAAATEKAQRDATDLYAKVQNTKDEDAKKKANANFKKAEALAKETERKLTSAKKELDRLTAKAAKAAEAAEERRNRLAAARKEAAKTGPAKSKAVSGKDVKQAAKAEGANASVKLNRAEIMKVLDEVRSVSAPGVVGIAEACIKLCEGVSTPGQFIKALAKITGETIEKAKK